MRCWVLALPLIAACAAADPALECEGYAGERALWCHAHKNALLRFARSTSDLDGRRSRLNWLRSTFYPAIHKVENDDAIHALIMTLEKEMPTFVRLYEQERFWAVRDSGQLNPDLRGPLMKAGFRHAIAELERELHPRP